MIQPRKPVAKIEKGLAKLRDLMSAEAALSKPMSSERGLIQPIEKAQMMNQLGCYFTGFTPNDEKLSLSVDSVRRDKCFELTFAILGQARTGDNACHGLSLVDVKQSERADKTTSRVNDDRRREVGTWKQVPGDWIAQSPIV